MNRELKILLVVAGVLVVVYLMNSCSSNKSTNNTVVVDNEVEHYNNTDYGSQDSNSIESFSDVQDIPKDDYSDSQSSDSSIPSVEFSKGEKERLNAKYNSKNLAREGKYKKVSYKEGVRGQSDADVAKFFDDNNSLVKDGYLGNDEYAGRDETNDQYASYRPGVKKSLTDEDIFKSENYLPKEANKDWFDVMPEPISIKNRHLINVSRPIGVNTIGNSLRNPSYDLRGSPPNPKFVVSPWMQSTIDPDLNIKGLC